MVEPGEFGKNALGWRYVEEFMEKLMKKLEKKYDTVILRGGIEYSSKIRFSNAAHDVSTYSIDDYLNIFVKKGDRYVETNISSVATVDVDDVVRDVESIFKHSFEQEEYIPPDVGFEVYDIIPGVYNDGFFDTDHLYEIYESIVDYDAGNINKISGIISSEASKSYILTSYGSRGELKSGRFSIRVRGFKDSQVSYTGSILSTSVDETQVSRMMEEIDNWLDISINPKLPEKISTRVVFTPYAFANLLSYMGFMLSAYMYIRGNSAFTGYLGQDIGSKAKLYDDARLESSPSVKTFDDEGLPTKRTVFFEDGILKDLAFNNTLAKKYNRESNGHAGLVFPTPHNMIYVHEENVARDLDEVLRVVDRGLLITNLWYTRFSNYREGSLSTMQRDLGFYIEGGELGGPVIGARLSMNIKDLVTKSIISTEPVEWALPWDVQTVSKVGYVAIDDVQITTGF